MKTFKWKSCVKPNLSDYQLKLIMKIIAKCLFRTVPLSIVIRLIKERAHICATSTPIPFITGRSRVTTRFSSQSTPCRMILRRLRSSKRPARGVPLPLTLSRKRFLFSVDMLINIKEICSYDQRPGAQGGG